MRSSPPTRRAISAGLVTTALGLGLGLPALAQGASASAARLADLQRAARGLDQLHTIAVQRGPDLLWAEALRGPGLDRPANVKSCSKSLLSLLVGSAIARGEIAGPDQRLADLAPDLIPANATPGVEDLTIGHLLTLRAGLEGTSGRNYGAWVSAPNWVSYALSRPMIDRPGGRMIYSTGTTHVLGAALSRATGQSLLSLARERLGAPLDIAFAPWPRDPQGFYFGGNDMALSPRAMLRVAGLVRDAGRDRAATVGESPDLQPLRDWLRLSLRPRTRSPYSGLDYGFGWFLSDSGWVLARGYGGQLIAAHPGRDLALAITSDPGRPARSEGYFGDLMGLLEGPVTQLA